MTKEAAPAVLTARSDKPAGAVAEQIRDEAFAPELCKSLAAPPTGDDWLHEVKWDGYRIVATVVRSKVRLWSRNAIEWTAKLPELVKAIGALKLKSAQLDGEMIVLRDGRDDFNALQARLSTVATKEPIVYMLFDLPHLNGQSLRNVPLVERKALLAHLLDANAQPALRYSEHQVGNGKAAFAQAIAAGMEGIVSKRGDSFYRGTRNGDWVKAKGRPSDEFIVIGFTEPKKSRAGIGALLLAQPRDGGLVYMGRVGTGLSDEQLRSLRKQLQKDVIDTPAADIALMARSDQKLGIWVKPRLVVEAYFQGIGGQGLLRQPAFKALRADKSPEDLLVEKAGKRKAPKPAATAKKVAAVKADATNKKDVAVKKGAAAKKGAAVHKIATAKKGEDATTTRSSRAAAAAVEKTAMAKTAGNPRRQNRAPTRFADGVVITHPEREVFPGTGVTKGDVAEYYRAVARWLLPELAGRPVSVVRCPGGIGQQCFFQKHVGIGWGEHVHGVAITESKGEARYLCIQDEAGVLELVQMNVLELHPWGAKSSDPEHADRIVFDLDPHATVEWPRVRAAARDVRRQLDSIGLRSFLRTSGGKGLHVVVPLDPPAPWDQVRSFAQAVAQAMAALRPKEYVSVAGEKKRDGKIFIDWLRNGRGATSVASYSLRARSSAGVAMPIAWEDLGRVRSGDAFTIRNVVASIARRADDPWRPITKVKQSLPAL